MLIGASSHIKGKASHKIVSDGEFLRRVIESILHEIDKIDWK